MGKFESILQILEALPAERLSEIEDYVMFIAGREEAKAFARSATAASAPAFALVWDNADDEIYDAA